MDALYIAGLTYLAGLAMVLGAILAYEDLLFPNWLNDDWRHGVIAFGGGALFAAVALVLVPEGSHRLSSLWIAFWMISGGLVFMQFDILLAAYKSPAAQLTAMLADFIPEALALGATFTVNHQVGLLLAILIGLQNIPEGFNAYRELTCNGKCSGRLVLTTFALMALLGPAAGLIGYYFLTDAPTILASIMLFAAGGILYLTFEDIAPMTHVEKHWAPPLGAVLGFVLGLVGQKMISV